MLSGLFPINSTYGLSHSSFEVMAGNFWHFFFNIQNRYATVGLVALGACMYESGNGTDELCPVLKVPQHLEKVLFLMVHDQEVLFWKTLDYKNLIVLH